VLRFHPSIAERVEVIPAAPRSSLGGSRYSCRCSERDKVQGRGTGPARSSKGIGSFVEGHRLVREGAAVTVVAINQITTNTSTAQSNSCSVLLLLVVLLLVVLLLGCVAAWLCSCLVVFLLRSSPFLRCSV